jgi:hypothetical protein
MSDRGRRVEVRLAPRLDLAGRTRAPATGRGQPSRIAPSGIAEALLPAQAGWRRQVPGWRGQLRTSGYAVLRDLFPSVLMAAVRTYYRRLEREGDLLDGDAHRRGAPLIRDEPLLVFLGAQLGAVVRQVTRERVRSTFSFLRVYGAGAVLARHRDRPACRWNVDLVVGGDPRAQARHCLAAPNRSSIGASGGATGARRRRAVPGHAPHALAIGTARRPVDGARLLPLRPR